jgi:hypothetical protein
VIRLKESLLIKTDRSNIDDSFSRIKMRSNSNTSKFNKTTINESEIVDYDNKIYETNIQDN